LLHAREYASGGDGVRKSQTRESTILAAGSRCEDGSCGERYVCSMRYSELFMKDREATKVHLTTTT